MHICVCKCEIFEEFEHKEQFTKQLKYINNKENKDTKF